MHPIRGLYTSANPLELSYSLYVNTKICKFNFESAITHATEKYEDFNFIDAFAFVSNNELFLDKSSLEIAAS